uniref:Abhydrolase_3 domain-containing protein n=1 Tax=Strongyloides venezuelensis TaxID=75913 RepID=A0A0K0FZ43_STRVS
MSFIRKVADLLIKFFSLILPNILGLYNVERAMMIRQFATTLGNSKKSKSTNNYFISNIDINNVECRFYKPKNIKNDCLIIYIHGGGWCTFNARMYDHFIENIIEKLNCHCISIDYILSPKKKFPYAIEECWNVIEGIASKNNEILKDILTDKVIVMGDSAGGNMTAVITQKASKHEKYKNFINGHVLIYPYLGSWDFNSESFSNYNKYPLFSILSPKLLAEFILIYLGETANNENVKMILESDSITGNFGSNNNLKNVAQNIEISPILADENILKNLPKSFTIIANYDILKDQGIIYHEKMKNSRMNYNSKDESNIENFHEIHIFESLTHGEINISKTTSKYVASLITNWLIKNNFAK